MHQNQFFDGTFADTACRTHGAGTTLLFHELRMKKCDELSLHWSSQRAVGRTVAVATAAVPRDDNILQRLREYLNRFPRGIELPFVLEDVRKVNVHVDKLAPDEGEESIVHRQLRDADSDLRLVERALLLRETEETRLADGVTTSERDGRLLRRVVLILADGTEAEVCPLGGLYGHGGPTVG